MDDCPKCGWPSAPQTDEAFYFRWKIAGGTETPIADEKRRVSAAEARTMEINDLIDALEFEEDKATVREAQKRLRYLRREGEFAPVGFWKSILNPRHPMLPPLPVHPEILRGIAARARQAMPD